MRIRIIKEFKKKIRKKQEKIETENNKTMGIENKEK